MTALLGGPRFKPGSTFGVALTHHPRGHWFEADLSRTPLPTPLTWRSWWRGNATLLLGHSHEVALDREGVHPRS